MGRSTHYTWEGKPIILSRPVFTLTNWIILGHRHWKGQREMDIFLPRWWSSSLLWAVVHCGRVTGFGTWCAVAVVLVHAKYGCYPHFPPLGPVINQPNLHRMCYISHSIPWQRAKTWCNLHLLSFQVFWQHFISPSCAFQQYISSCKHCGLFYIQQK